MMLRPALLAVLVSLLLVVYPTAIARAAAPHVVYVANESTSVSDAEVANALPALQASVSEDLAPVWGVDATLVQASDISAISPDAWTITLSDWATDCTCEGYHWLYDGVPRGKVFVAASAFAGDAWPLVFDHEAKELLVDPWVNYAMLGGSMFRLVEVADPVEDARVGYTRPGLDGEPVGLSDFVTPAWYRRWAHPPYDFTGHVKRPFQLLKNGYVSYWRDGRWQQQFAP